MSDNNLLIDFKLSKNKISAFIHKEINFLFDDKITIEGIELSLEVPLEETIEIQAYQKSVISKIPVSFSFIKPAGLFSIEGKGEIQVSLEIQYEIDENLQLTTNSILKGYEWINEPKLIVGQLTFPVETISDCIINYMKEEMLDKLDVKISKLPSLKSILTDKLTELGANYPIHRKPDLYFNSQLLTIQSNVLSEDKDSLMLHLWLEIMSKISDEPIRFEIKQDPRFFWSQHVNSQNIQKVELEFSFAGLAKLIINEINGNEFGGKSFDVESIHIRNTDELEFKVNLRQPIKGIITLVCKPFLDVDQQNIYLNDLSIDIDASNIIYKLSSPIIEKIIRSKIESFLPYNPSSVLLPFIEKIPSIQILDNMVSLKPQVDKIYVESLTFDHQSVHCMLTLQGAEVDISI
jgi:hypothetical protein